MLQYLLQYGLFLAESVTVVAAALVVMGGLVMLIRQAKSQSQETLEIKNLNDRFQHIREHLYSNMLDKAARKARAKRLKRSKKAEKKAAKSGNEPDRSRLFVLDFDGDIRASAVANLREEISAVLQIARPEDEVLLRLESPGGVVHGYGLAASQLARLRQRDVGLTVAVDKVAASGGYMMASVAERIIAAPFAIVGSIGVIGQVPNFNRWLKERNIDYEMQTAGKYKRTLTIFGENTDEAREKFREELEETHQLFKSFISQYRPNLDVDSVATGEHWYGTRAKELRLVDEVQTSDDYMLNAVESRDIFEIHHRRKKTLPERIMGGNGQAMGKLADWLIGGALRRREE